MIKRVFLPFLAAMVILTIFVFWQASNITSELIDSEYWQQLDRIARMLGEHPYLRNPIIQSQIEELVGAKIGYYDRQGNPHPQPLLAVAPSTSMNSWPVLPKDIMEIAAGSQRPVLTPQTGSPDDSRILLVQIPGNPGSDYMLALRTPTGPRQNLRKNLFFALASNAGLSLLLILLLTLSFSKIFSRQLNGLLTTLEKVAEGDLRQHIPEKGSHEWRRIATAFNTMVGKLEHYQQRLRTSERLAAVGELSAILAHEVRNPLTSLKMLGQVLKARHKKEPETVQLIEPMLGEIDRIELLVQSILDWSRPSPPHREQADCNVLIAEVVELMQPLLTRSGVKIAWQPQTIAPVSADKAQLKQVLWNLLKNAQNVSVAGDTISVATRMADATRLQLTVIDQGPGIADSDRDKIFDPFYTTKTRGLGLGLTISRRIVEEHGGTLLLENSELGGAMATILLPIIADLRQAENQPENHEE